MAIQKINDGELLDSGRYHISQPDVPHMSADEMKNFFDNVSREVLIPKVNEIIDGVNEALGLDGTGTERTFVTPDISISFVDGFYLNATAQMLTDDGLYLSGTEYHLMDVMLESGSVKKIYLRSNYSGSYSVHPDAWTWNTDILADGPVSNYINMTGYGKVKITAVSELARKYISLLPALDPTFKYATEQYVEGLAPADRVVSFSKNGNWYCKVWSSGIKECWYSAKKSYSTTERGGYYYDDTVGSVSFPSQFFTAAPAVFATSAGDKSNVALVNINSISQSSVSFGITTGKAASGQVTVNLYCIGE